MWSKLNFKKEVKKKSRSMRLFLSRLTKNPPRGLDAKAEAREAEVWKKVECLNCAACCKEMTPTYTASDMKRIAGHLGISVEAMKSKWLKLDRNGDWVNRSTPCQFLDLKTNKCRIYAIRPSDCSGFPHLSKKKMVDYLHVHHQNLSTCPATFLMVENLKKSLDNQ